MKTWKIWLLACGLAGLSGLASALETHGNPAPWPFPWAKECVVNWETMEGRYVLYDNAHGEEIDLWVSVVNHDGYRRVEVGFYGSNGYLQAKGATLLENSDRILEVMLNPVRAGVPMLKATVQFFYTSSVKRCTDQYVTPVLTLEAPESNAVKPARYRLVRTSPH